MDTPQLLMVLTIGALIYVLPIAIAHDRRVPNVGSVAVVNIIFGWSLIGWGVALAMALRDPR